MWTYNASGGNSASDTRPGCSSAIVGIEELKQASERERAVADAVLLRGIELRGGASELRQQKQRVIAEAVGAARRARNLALPDAFGDQRARIVGVSHENHHAAVIAGTLIAQRSEQLGVVAGISFVARAFVSRVVRRMDARLPAERIDAQA